MQTSVPLSSKDRAPFFTIAAIFLLTLLGGKSWGQTTTIAGWDPNGITAGTSGPSPWSQATANSNVTIGGITRASGVGTSASAVANGWLVTMGTGNLTTANAAMTNNQFITWTIKPNSNYTASLSTFDLNYRRSSAGPQSGLLQYSTNGTSFTDIANLGFSSTSTSGASVTQVSLASVPGLQNISSSTTITFRLIFYNNGGAGGFWYVYDVSSPGNDLIITGTVTAVGNTAPSLSSPTSASVTTTGATLGANITSDGGASITARGTVWGTTAAPTGNGLNEGGTSAGVFVQARTGFTPNTLYTFRGYATNSVGTGYSTDGNFTTVHNAPGIAAETNIAQTSFTANWSAPTGGGSAAFTYQIQVSTDNTFATTVADVSSIASNNTSQNLTGLSVSTTYYYRVRANNAGGNSAWSTTSSPVQTLAATVPGQPTAVFAAAGNTQATVTFTAPASNGGAAILDYAVTSSPGNITATGSASPITVTGLTNGTAYTFTVTARNSVGTGSPSSASNSVTPGVVTYTFSTTTTSTAWANSNNWTGGASSTFPGTGSNSNTTAYGSTSDIAEFGSFNIAGTQIGFNMGTSGNTGVATNSSFNGSATLGAIILTNTSNQALVLGNSSNSNGILTLTGNRINGVSNTILRNVNSNLLTIQNSVGGSGTFELALGNTTDNIISIESSGGITISSIITGAGRKLTKVGSGTGVLTLSGVNTYSGITTISAGTFALSGSGSISSSPNIFIGSGATLDVTGLTTALSLGSGQTLSASATGSNSTGTVTVSSTKGLTLSAGGLAITAYGGGSTAPLTVSGTSAGFLALNNAPVIVTTTTALSAGTYKLIGKSGSATGVTGTPGTLTIAGSGLALGTVGTLSVSNGELILTLAVQTPTITGAATASAVNTTYGTPSAVQTFAISGSNLTTNLVATAPTGFEVSSDGTTYGSTANFTQSGGTASGTLRVRLAATATVSGSYNSQNIVLSSTGATSVNITTAASNNVVLAKGLTITGLTASDKPYDGSTNVTVSGTPAYAGLVNGESFTVTGSVTWAFPDANAGSNKTLTRTGFYDAPSTNYIVTQPTLTAAITKVSPTLTVTNTPITYNGSAQAASVNGSVPGAVSNIKYNGSLIVPTNAGSYSITADFTPTDETNYNSLSSASAGNFVIQSTTSTISTTAATSVTQTTASSGGNVTSDGGAIVTAKGVVWSTSANPTIALSTKTNDGSGTGSFTSSITGLASGTTYYYRAYATNSEGTSYGPEYNFTTPNDPAFADFRTKASGNFSNANSWEYNTGSGYGNPTNSIPTATNNVSILHPTVLDQDFTVGANREFTISAGTLTVAPGKSLTIAGTGNFNDQPVTFRSDATGTAMLGIVSGSLTGATNITIERYLPARRTWRILTAPLTNTGSVFANWQNNGSATGTTGAEIWAPGATSGSGLTAAGNAPSMQYFDYLSNKWINVTDTKGTSLSGTTNQGFSIFVTGPFGSPNYITSGSAPTTLVAHGALQVGNHQALYANPAGHYILVPNPYAAPVDFAKVTRSSNIPDGFWAWDPTLGGTGSYATVSKDGSAYDIAPASSAQTQVIQNGQAVFVKSTDNTAASLTFHEADKDISKASGQVFRQAGTASKLYINLNKLVNNTPKIADGVLAKFGEGYKAEAGSDDAAKLFGNEENIAIRRSGAYLSIERRPDVVKYDTLFLNIFKMKAGPYSLEVKPDNFDITGLKATIRDKFLNTQTTVDLINGTTLTFMVTTDAASYAADRFIVVFEQQKVLAVTFTGLKAFELNGNVQVEWQMAEAPDADYYEVERSLDGRSFTVAAQLAAKHSGTTESYAWLDKQAQAGTNYYRITMYTKEAAVLKSSIVQVVLAKGAPAIAAFPNPVVNRLVQLQLRNMQTGSYVISIYNTAGIQVAAKKVTLTTPNATQTLTLPKGTAAGNYQAVIKDAQGHQWYQPIAVQ